MINVFIINIKRYTKDIKRINYRQLYKDINYILMLQYEDINSQTFQNDLVLLAVVDKWSISLIGDLSLYLATKNIYYR